MGMWQERLASVTDSDPLSQDITIPRGFVVWTDDIFSKGSWSDPVFFDAPGIDQDVSCEQADLYVVALLTDEVAVL
jgi:hypothetical protein